MKKRIIEYLKTDRSFEGGVKIYQEHGQTMSFKQTLNRQGYSKYNHELLLDQLRQLACIDQAEFNSIIAVPVVKGKAKKEVSDERPTVKVSEIPEEIKKTIRLRKEFPFLNDDDCPNELKILVADRITAYHKYVEAHKVLFVTDTIEELGELAGAVVENYLENQEIWDELNHYKENKEVLGKHPVFAQEKRKAEIMAMPTGDQVKLLNNLNNYISRSTKEVTDAPEADNSETLAKIEQWKWELSVLQDILKIDPKKITPKPKATPKKTTPKKKTTSKKTTKKNSKK